MDDVQRNKGTEIEMIYQDDKVYFEGDSLVKWLTTPPSKYPEVTRLAITFKKQLEAIKSQVKKIEAQKK